MKQNSSKKEGSKKTKKKQLILRGLITLTDPSVLLAANMGLFYRDFGKLIMTP